ncbi:hydroperoxide isomerase ALOXE3-like isoform 3-T3 [Pholidichthys leucotaenia]
MFKYQLEVTTGDMKHAGTMDHIYITIFGSEAQSDRTELDNFGIDFRAGKVGTYIIKTKGSLGELLLVKVEKDPHGFFPEDEWFCSKIVVTNPEGDAILFPCHRWISRGELVELRGGKAVQIFKEDHPLLINHRKKEVMIKKDMYKWEIDDEKLPHHIHFKDVLEFPAELRFSFSKTSEMLNAKRKMAWLDLLNDGKILTTLNTSSGSGRLKYQYVAQHWKDDDFFGYQFLNATNPTVIKRCLELPPNFPVTEEMVKPFLEDGSSLKKEMERGKIFICDQRIMDGIPTRKYNGDCLHVSSGFCLFYLNQEHKLMPVAIQLRQQPSEQNPIFLPSDPEPDWLLAKLFVKSTDVMMYEVVHHLLITHLLAEVFTVATLRNFPVIHPLYKLLVPHFRFTLHINTQSRILLFAPDGTLDRFDYHFWIPNGSLLLCKPPPTNKGQSSMETILETLPNVGETVEFAVMFWLLCDKYSDLVVLGDYPEERFDEPTMKQMIKEFQAELSYLSEAITARNSKLDLPYTYLDPKEIENSVTI